MCPLDKERVVVVGLRNVQNLRTDLFAQSTYGQVSFDEELLKRWEIKDIGWEVKDKKLKPWFS